MGASHGLSRVRYATHEDSTLSAGLQLSCPCRSIVLGAPQGIVLTRFRGEEAPLVNAAAAEYLRDLGIPETGPALQARFIGSVGPGAPLVEKGEISSARRTYEFTNYYFDGSHLLFIEDVTERKRYESIAANADMANNTALLLSSLRHELGNPVNSLKMALSVLGDNYDAFDDGRRREYIARSLEQVKVLEELLVHLRSFHAMHTFTPEPMRLDLYYEDYCSFLREVAGQRNTTLSVTPCTEPLVVLAHRRALHQSLTNLTTNAFEALEQVREARLELEVIREAGYATVEVRDNGPGIATDTLRDVFSPLFSTKENGTGMGLAIVRNLMLAMRGDVEVQSTEGQGTTARLVLRRVDQAAAMM